MCKVVKKLKQIRRTVQNIPGKNINLDTWVTEDGSSYKHSIMCPAAWITTDVFVGDKLSLAQDGYGYWTIHYKKHEDFCALAKFIGITDDEAEDLFGPSFMEDGNLTHKKIFLNRINHLIEIYE